MTSGPTYTFSTSSALANEEKKYRSRAASQKQKNNPRHYHASSSSHNNNNDDSSLTYSANSSVVSGGSETGQSTDSSFADIMKVLDMQQDDGRSNKELQALLRKEGVSSTGELRARHRMMPSGTMSVNSLQYSTDGESHLDASQLLQTIAGQPSDSYAFDGGAGGGARGGMTEEPIQAGDTDILFAPAEPAQVKKKKKRRDQQQQEDHHHHSHRDPHRTPSTKHSSSPVSTRSTSSYHQQQQFDESPSPSIDTPTKSPPSSSSDMMKPDNPPPLPPKGFDPNDIRFDEEDDEDIWYAKWWMSCFPDAFRNLMPKR